MQEGEALSPVCGTFSKMLVMKTKALSSEKVILQRERKEDAS